jgi:hypothetical protein
MRADEETHKDDGGDVVVLDPGLHVDRLARVDDDDRIGARPGDLVDEAAGVVSELEVGTVGAWGKRVEWSASRVTKGDMERREEHTLSLEGRRKDDALVGDRGDVGDVRVVDGVGCQVVVNGDSSVARPVEDALEGRDDVGGDAGTAAAANRDGTIADRLGGIGRRADDASRRSRVVVAGVGATAAAEAVLCKARRKAGGSVTEEAIGRNGGALLTRAGGVVAENGDAHHDIVLDLDRETERRVLGVLEQAGEGKQVSVCCDP